DLARLRPREDRVSPRMIEIIGDPIHGQVPVSTEDVGIHETGLRPSGGGRLLIGARFPPLRVGHVRRGPTAWSGRHRICDFAYSTANCLSVALVMPSACAS